MVTLVTRFAPSPTGYLHLGHALSALTVYDIAQREGGRFLLRIEDIDFERCRPEYETAIYEDLAWLGLTWEQPVRRQSDHMQDYAAALFQLKSLGVVYPCFCSRKDIAKVTKGDIYPRTCVGLSPTQVEEKLNQGLKPGWRLDMQYAFDLTGPLTWHDREEGTVPVLPEQFGDVIVARRDNPTSYHLSVTVDDHIQAITLVVRGIDLFESTPIHRTLQALLGYETPAYYHHRLMIDDATGLKLSKRDGSAALRDLRKAGVTLADIRSRIACGT